MAPSGDEAGPRTWVPERHQGSTELFRMGSLSPVNDACRTPNARLA
jgi:hypothetical protein